MEQEIQGAEEENPPNMAIQHRPDMEAWRNETPAKRAKGTRFREAYMWPYINQEDLLKSKALLIFLGVRGRHHTHLGEVLGATIPAFLNEYTMYFHDRTTGIIRRISGMGG